MCRQPSTWLYLPDFPGASAGNWSWLEQSELKTVPIWEVGAARNDLTCWDTVPAFHWSPHLVNWGQTPLSNEANHMILFKGILQPQCTRQVRLKCQIKSCFYKISQEEDIWSQHPLCSQTSYSTGLNYAMQFNCLTCVPACLMITCCCNQALFL